MARVSQRSGSVPEKTSEERIAAIEACLGDKRLDEHFREQAELIHRLFAYRFGEFHQRWTAVVDARLAALEQSLESRLETRLESSLETTLNAKLEPVKRDLAVIKHTAKTILTR